jgi:hypothetical protein
MKRRGLIGLLFATGTSACGANIDSNLQLDLKLFKTLLIFRCSVKFDLKGKIRRLA